MLLDADIGGPKGNGPVLVLLHGMGATREVWRPLIRVLEAEWHGRWIAPDLRGHGRSPRALSYSLGEQAVDIAETVGTLASNPVRISVLGHSMGGVIALALASGWFGMRKLCDALGLGIKIVWTEQGIAALGARARAAAKVFESREAAAAFYLKVSGLAGIVSTDDEIAQAGVSADGLRLAADPAVASIGPPRMVGLIAAADYATVFLAAGESDPMCTMGDMRSHDRDAKLIPGAGHNAMVEAPERVWAWVKQCIR
jgi:pimeloyl-ACP methyl ester carboxylesterase